MKSWEDFKAIDAVEDYMGIEDTENVITMTAGKSSIKMKPNGNFYVNGRLTANDLEVYKTFKEIIENWEKM